MGLGEDGGVVSLVVLAKVGKEEEVVKKDKEKGEGGTRMRWNILVDELSEESVGVGSGFFVVCDG